MDTCNIFALQVVDIAASDRCKCPNIGGGPYKLARCKLICYKCPDTVEGRRI